MFKTRENKMAKRRRKKAKKAKKAKKKKKKKKIISLFINALFNYFFKKGVFYSVVSEICTLPRALSIFF